MGTTPIYRADEVVVVEPDPAWRALYQAERARLAPVIEPVGLGIEHVGSTSVPGLAAKPIVDILVEVTDLEQTKTRVAPLLEAQGYDYFWRPTSGDDGPPFYAWFIKRDRDTRARTHHIHMVEAHFVDHWERLLFRDYLIGHPQVATDYQALKLGLASRFPNDRIAYTHGKTEFIARVTELARRHFGGAAG